MINAKAPEIYKSKDSLTQIVGLKSGTIVNYIIKQITENIHFAFDKHFSKSFLLMLLNFLKTMAVSLSF